MELGGTGFVSRNANQELLDEINLLGILRCSYYA